jgi:hypothetical protein
MIFTRADFVSVPRKTGGSRVIHHKLELLHSSLLTGLIFKSGILHRIPANERCLQARFEPRVGVSWGFSLGNYSRRGALHIRRRLSSP